MKPTEFRCRLSTAMSFAGSIARTATLSLTFAACHPRAAHPERLYFFENEPRAIIVPVTINGGAVAQALFDTGGSSRTVELDSTFFATNISLMGISPDVQSYDVMGDMTGWARKGDPKVFETIYPSSPISVKMCGVDMKYDNFYTKNGANRVGRFEACFSFSAKDTTHVWELNFRHNYMEAHPAAGFTMPEGCRVMPLVTPSPRLSDMYVRFPLKVTCPDGATTTIDQLWFIDTGMLSDFALLESAEQYGFFSDRDDAVLLNGHNSRRYKVDAEAFDGVKLDETRIYLNQGSWMLEDEEIKGGIGLNFMKRFNVFLNQAFA